MDSAGNGAFPGIVWNTSPLLRLSFAGFPWSAVARQPVGTGSAQIRRSIVPNKLPGQMALRQEEPIVPGVLDQATAGLHQSLLQVRQRPAVDSLRQYGPSPRDLSQQAGRLRAIEAFLSESRSGFFKPVRAMMSFSRSGFAMLALDSLLIETMEKSIRGSKETPNGHGEAFFSALPSFRGALDNTKADPFRKTIRNGILHQAEVKGPSLVRPGPLVELTASGDGVIVNPVLFHCRLENAFAEYVAELKVPASPLWKPFRDKMECIGGRTRRRSREAARARRTSGIAQCRSIFCIAQSR